MASFFSFMKEHPHFNNKHNDTGDHLMTEEYGQGHKITR